MGPDADPSHRMDVFIDDIRQTFTDFFQGMGFPPWLGIDGRMDAQGYRNQALSLLTLSDQKLDIVNNMRVTLGTQQRRMIHIVDDLQAQFINITAGKSRIEDADFAEEVTALTRNQILNQSAQAAAAQANVQPLAVNTLLNAIYDGLTPELARVGSPSSGGAAAA